MKDTFLELALRYAEAHANRAGIASCPIPGLSVIHATHASELQYAVSQPLVAIVLQGRKRVRMGSEVYDFGVGDSLIISADVPTVSQITEASVGDPYCSVVMELDKAVLAELAVEIKAAPLAHYSPIRVEPTDAEVEDAAHRMMRLVERPTSLPILSAQMVREFHYWLLCGRHGPAIRDLGWPNTNSQKIGRAISLLRRDFDKPLRVAMLADAAGMSPSTFHQHFKAITSLSPVQFQKQLRLIEARRQMLSEDCSPSIAAFNVGYESVPQFTREYARMFGLPPARETQAALASMRAA